jgi:hypothetical protein
VCFTGEVFIKAVIFFKAGAYDIIVRIAEDRLEVKFFVRLKLFPTGEIKNSNPFTGSKVKNFFL